METRLNQSPTKVLKLLPSLNEQVIPFRDFDLHTLPSIASPDVQPWITRTAVDSQEIEIRVETGENSVFLAVFDKV